MKKQIVIIHGGDTFGTYEEYWNFLENFEINLDRYKTDRDDWKRPLRSKLGEEYEVILPAMPNKTNAQFKEWKLWMDKVTELLEDEVILIGHSLGATFLAKYLSENTYPKKITGVFLVSGVFDADSSGYGLYSFALSEKFAEKLNLQSDHVFLYHSKDDHVVPFSALEKFSHALPTAQVRILDGRGHLNQEDFPELVEDIKSLK